VVVIDVAIALGANFDIHEGVTGQLIEHMIKKAHASRDIGETRPIEVEADLDVCLLSFACDCALAHGDFFASSRFARQ
jgi:hypothetical protein